MDRILVSACLLGQPVRYDGSAKSLSDPVLEQWRVEGRLVPICPELAGGFTTPRPPAEIADGADGSDVLTGRARIVEVAGTDVTHAFVAGAEAALALALANGCAFALLTDGSPSCGSGFIYDGTFTGRVHTGAGVVASLLRANGIEVFSDRRIEELKARLAASDRRGGS